MQFSRLLIVTLPFDRPIAPVVVTALVYGIFLLARLNAHGFEPSYFIVAGTNQYDSRSADPGLRTVRHGDGYDGAYYYRLAIEPWSRKLVDHGIVAAIRNAFAATPGSDKRAAQYYFIPVLFYAAWRTYLRSLWAQFRDVQVFGEAFGAPFRGLAVLWSHAFAIPTWLSIAWCTETFMLAVLSALAVHLFHRHQGFEIEKASLILYVIMAICLTGKYWVEDQAFLRLTAEIFLLAMLGLLLDGRRVLYSISFAWLLAAIFTVRWRVEW